MNKKILFYLMMSVLMAGCAAGDSESLGDKPPVGATSDGKYAVGFNAYANRAVTRAGYAGTLTIDQLQQAQGDLGGFGVFAYYTDLKKYDQTYIPNFMYNQGVFYSGGNWQYTPVMYWPNEYGSDAGSDDEDKVSFFAYAPYVHHSSPAAGSVDGDTSWGITGFSRNTTAGDPIVKYIASFNPAQSVDLCWGVCDQASWNRIQNNGSQSMTTGLPWLDVEHPQGVNQKMTFTFKHALSQLNVQIDADADGLTHDASGDIADGTKIYVRSISFTGIALKGALNLNNTVAN
ncbi:MAG: fimbrillin family protein, partial [Prevotella sp.]|nr:fimbrillin family protein [Prevotella sp.]